MANEIGYAGELELERVIWVYAASLTGIYGLTTTKDRANVKGEDMNVGVGLLECVWR